MDVSLKVCRICFSNESKEELANWCNCSGTIGLMHKSCLEQWIFHSDIGSNAKCEICNHIYDFRIEMVKPSFKKWLFRPITSFQDWYLVFTIIFYLTSVPSICIYGNANNYMLLAFTTCSLFVTCYGYFYKWQKENRILSIRIKNESKVAKNHSQPVLAIDSETDL